ncbi:MAG: helix-turn-helix domain-containing protein [Pseudomonadota bacterium]
MQTDAGPTVLTTRSVAEEDRLEYWCDAICSTYVELECDVIRSGDQPEPLFGELKVDDVSGLELSHVSSSAQLVKRTKRCIQKSDRDHFLISVQREGDGALRQDGRTAHLGPGQFALYDSTRPYELQFGGPFRQTVLRIPRALMLDRLPTAEWLTARTLNGGSGLGKIALGTLEEIADQDMAIPKPYSERLRDLVLDLMTLACAETADHGPAEASNTQLVQLRSAQQFIEEHLAEVDLSPARIAAAQRISVRYLNMLFAMVNTTASRWIWKRRLDFARSDLSDPRRSALTISEIAYRWGFNDISHFSRAFRKEFDMSPKEFRASLNV